MTNLLLLCLSLDSPTFSTLDNLPKKLTPLKSLSYFLLSGDTEPEDVD